MDRFLRPPFDPEAEYTPTRAKGLDLGARTYFPGERLPRDFMRGDRILTVKRLEILYRYRDIAVLSHEELAPAKEDPEPVLVPMPSPPPPPAPEKRGPGRPPKSSYQSLPGTGGTSNPSA